jgi:hypothetical protein
MVVNKTIAHFDVYPYIRLNQVSADLATHHDA